MNSAFSNLSLFAFALLKCGAMTGILPAVFLAGLVEAKYPYCKRFFVYGAEMLARLYRVACPPSAEELVSVGKSKSFLRRVA